MTIAASSISSCRTRRSASSSATGERVDLHAQPGAGLVDEVDRLVGEETVGDVALRQDGRGRERSVADADAVVRLVALLQPAQDRDRVGDGRLADEHRLEAPLERRVLLDVQAVLVERRRADRSQLAAREHRLQQVAGRDRAFGGACTDDRVQLVDEEDDLARRGGDLLQHGLQPLLELAAVLRARDQRPDVERPHALALEALGHVAGDDALREPLGDRGLADARLADQHRVVLRAPRQHLDHATDLLVATDHRVELAELGQRGQVAAVLLERLVGALRILGRHLLAAAHVLQRGEQRVAGTTSSASSRCSTETYSSPSFAHLVERPVEHATDRGRGPGLRGAARHGRLCAQPRLGVGAQRIGIGGCALEQGAWQLLVEQRDAQVLGVELGIAEPARELLRAGDRLAALDRQLVEIHVSLLRPRRSLRG